jgi:hypothetical protein
MHRRVPGALLALLLGLQLSPAALAQGRSTIAVLPAQYFLADPQSAENLTMGLTQQFESQGYSVLPMDRTRSTAQEIGYEANRHYADSMALRIGRRLNAGLVAYPRLLALGVPWSAEVAPDGLLTPAAVVHLRVLNTRTGRPVYFRQVAHELGATRPLASEFSLPQAVAIAAAQEVTQRYFARVAGSREEIGRAR